MKVWVAVFLLAIILASSMSVPVIDPSTTTDRAVEEFKQAASLDFDYIKNDLQSLQQSYADFIRTKYLHSVGTLSEAVNQTYEEDMPKDTALYNLLCLEGIYYDVEDMREDLNNGLAVCANLSQSATRVGKNKAQFQTIISSLGEFSENLTNLINVCIEKIPKISWDRLQCVLNQVDIITDRFNPVFDRFKLFNVAMNGHLMLLGIETSLCYQQALRRLTEISKKVLRDIDYCKIPMS